MSDYIEYQREYQKARYNRFRAERRCTRCGKIDERTKAGRVCCVVCAGRNYDDHKKRYYRRKSESRCVLCGKQDNRTLKGKVCCFSCAVKQTQSQEKKGAAGNGNSQAAMTKKSN